MSPEAVRGLKPCFTVELRRGDALYVPVSWAHQVEALPSHVDGHGDDNEPVLSLSRFLPTPLCKLVRAPCALLWTVRIRTYHAWSDARGK